MVWKILFMLKKLLELFFYLEMSWLFCLRSLYLAL